MTSYRVMTMREVAEVPWNGLTVASTFSGCGGSCLGYRMAGFRVVWANEFIPAAQEVYKANHPGSFLNKSDIREVTADDIRSESGFEEIDVLDGSPPCSSFSNAGKRQKNWGKVKQYSDTEQRTDDLFFEYVRILRELQPKAFVAENVPGLVKGRAKGIFLEIMSEMKSCGYAVAARALDAQWLGVPQVRKRLIFIGLRSDIGKRPIFPKPDKDRVSLFEAIGRGVGPVEPDTDISRYAIGREWHRLPFGGQSTRAFQRIRADPGKPSPTICASDGGAGSYAGVPCAASVTHPYECRKFSVAELKRICAFPDDFVFNGSWLQNWERMGRAVPPVMMKRIAEKVSQALRGTHD